MNLRCKITQAMLQPREVQYSFFIQSGTKQMKTFLRQPVKSEKKTKRLDRIMTDSTLFLVFFFFIIRIFSSAIRHPPPSGSSCKPIVMWLTRARLSLSSSLLIGEGSLWRCYFAKSLLKLSKQWVWLFLNLFPSYVRVVEPLSFPLLIPDGSLWRCYFHESLLNLFKR